MGDGQEPAAASAERIVCLLRSRRAGDRAEARRQVQELGPRAQDVMRLVLRTCLRADRRWAWIAGGGFVLVASVALALQCLGPLAASPGVSVVGAVLAAALYASLRGQETGRAVGLLDELAGPAGIGLLAEALWMDRGPVRVQAARLLAQTLPGMPPGTALALSPAQRGDLYRMLSLWHGQRLSWSVPRPAGVWTRFDGAVLDLAQRDNDAVALPYVGEIASWAGRGALGDAARACRDYLQRVSAREREAASLLRPAHAPGQDVLLRPAQPAGEPPEQLLRPVHGAQGSDEQAQHREAREEQAR